MEDLIPAMKSNVSLTNIDIRFNSGHTDKIKQLLALCLLKNIDKLKKSKI